ncbi:RusA family crossover junction endodeoxyribonuclease [Paenibacillus alvei]|uniref:RusA family crossover junction endodeoxyribonuclease n=1 Tax=Paenibacillus alvei TaxID=44250 RepID=UPI0002880A6A|nr:RusA family crossover junction endodeoxyribonuclease [Paenibacillus alvei]EJW19033.1 holliday junction resolvase [Paenibacillus alvei DSM 29]MCY9539198.1 RusA family crossover junction endodeoxyribonuclease [Paenibacillus alvei]MCY9708777.1 RusA family crossover junction endodeoxyribonuclease [Paenibacillus alvei]MCY9738114.1 RusA family crossover junction endodeoxyribonuclease [Paenibacillus alvei]MCY9758879.1 RusA family crossover junction endodeoxyribonuclease [Paenibacillus alvei]
MIEFTIYGDPVAQGRPKFSTAGGFPRAYDPKKSRDFKDYVKLAASEHAPDELITEPLRLEVTFYRQMPKSFSKKKAVEAEEGRLLPVTKPDIDNYLKAVKDALNGVIWRDDSCVTDVSMKKRYSSKPRIEISINKAV